VFVLTRKVKRGWFREAFIHLSETNAVFAGRPTVKKLTTVMTMICSVFAAAPLFAVEEHHPEKDKKPSQVSPAPSDKQAQEQMSRMQERMKKMQEQMEKVQQTTDPKERQKLMQEHMQTMHEQMMDMRGMGGGMMMRGMGEGMRMGGGPRPGMSAEKRMDMMEKRMDMMQMMMEQMMQREKAEKSLQK
jgi:hypothetical protein